MLNSADLSSRRRLFRRKAEGALEALDIEWPDLRVDQARRALAVERSEQLLGGDASHVDARLRGEPGGVRARQHVVELQQRMVGPRRLLVPDVETGARDALAQRLEQSLLIVNEATCGGDEKAFVGISANSRAPMMPRLPW